MHEIDTARLDLAREFRRRPFGRHSPDLQYLLHRMRSYDSTGHWMLVMTQPHAQWTLARMPAGGRELPRLTNVTFTSLAEAEWHVFKLRWKDLTGQDLPIE
jgi:N,N-dimethylformamidase